VISDYPSATLARFAAELRFEQIPEAVVRRAEDLFLDWFGSALAGRGARAVETIERFAREMDSNGQGRGAHLAPSDDTAFRGDGERRGFAFPSRTMYTMGRYFIPARWFSHQCLRSPKLRVARDKTS
jgi:hypothetical protein